MEEVLGFDNILGEDEIDNLFVQPEDDGAQEEQQEQDGSPEEEEEDNPSEPEGKPERRTKKNDTAEIADPESLFDDEAEEQPESVGSGKEKRGKKEDAVPAVDESTSPDNFYSSIADACAVDGIFPSLDEKTIKEAVDAESFSALIDKEVNARLDDRQRRIAEVLDSGVEPSSIRKYENTIGYLNNLTDEEVTAESKEGEQLRYNLIYQDFINKGLSPEKAKKFTDRTIDSGNDVEDAKEALQSNKEFFTEQYDKMVADAKAKSDAEKEERARKAKQLETSLMKDKNLLGDIDISNDIRRKAYEAVSKPVYKDPETGKFLTAIQRYESENGADFLKYAGLLFAMSDGFKDFSTMFRGKVQKEVRKGFRELEHKLNNTRRSSDGNLRMVTKAKDDPESFISGGLRLDL